MKIFADLHIHSRYARACSRELTPQNLAIWCDKKGISVVGTGDFTHPKWLQELKDNLVESKPGLYSIRGHKAQFICTAEVSSIYKQGEKVRRVHNLIFAPSLGVVEKLNKALIDWGANLSSDGRPIMGLHCPELVKLVKEVDDKCEIIPAHAWTPHFGIFGSLSGFDSLEEAFGDQSEHIFAIETGLSSDPLMNWQVEALDNLSLISNSDPHSLHRLGRECNAFEIEPNSLSYDEIISVIKSRDPKRFLYTIEFFPEEGRYHYDGHADCKFSCPPEKTKELGGVCPVCKKHLLKGVMYRVDELGTRTYGYRPKNPVPFFNVISLEELIANLFGVGIASKKVQFEYERLVAQRPEFDYLVEIPETELADAVGESLTQVITRMRRGKVHIEAGYDGLYGKIEILDPEEREALLVKPKQISLF